MSKRTCSHCGSSEEAFSAVAPNSIAPSTSVYEQAFSSPTSHPTISQPCKCKTCGAEDAYPAISSGFSDCGCQKKTCRKCYPPGPVAACFPMPLPTCPNPVDPYGEASKYYENFKTPGAPRQFAANSREAFARIDETFVFPDLTKSAQVRISNVKLCDGQVISHPDYGSLRVYKIPGCDPCTYLATNIRTEESEGDLVPCGTEFGLGSNEFSEDEEEDTLGCNHLIEDFTVPAVSGTASAKVERVANFVVGDKVVIRDKINPNTTYIFTLSDLTTPDTLLLENTGQGGTVGAVYSAADSIYCVEPLNTLGACSQAISTECITSLLGCDADGNLSKITAEHQNEVLVWDEDCDGFTPKKIPKVIKCVTLKSCFQVAPVDDICDQPVVTIETDDDQGLLDEATRVLLSPNAEPQISICDYPFSLNLLDSAVGAIKITPIFNPYEVVEFCDLNCPVCIPEDCCFQCNPQVGYPDSRFFPPGLNDATTVAIPTNLLQSAGEYKFSIVKSSDGTTNILLYHNPTSNAVEHAYNGVDGAEIDLETLPGDTNDYFYHKETLCNQATACPVDGRYKEDILARIFTMPPKMQAVLNYHSLLEVFRCDEIGDEGLQLTETSFSILANFTGPTHVVTVADGLDPWGTPAPVPDGAKTYDSFSGYNERSVSIFYPTCLVVTTVPRLLIRVDDGWEVAREVWAYDTAFTFTVPAGAIERFKVGDRVKWTQDATVKESIISVVADTVITILAGTVANSAITDVQWSKGINWEDTTIPPANDFIYFNMETTSMFMTQII